MNIQDIPDIDDEFIGYAILSFMIFFMFIWITSPVSPINFPNRATYGALVTHLEVILVVIIPFAMLAAVESLGGTQRTIRTKSASSIQNATMKLQQFRIKHSGKRGRYVKNKESEV